MFLLENLNLCSTEDGCRDNRQGIYFCGRYIILQLLFKHSFYSFFCQWYNYVECVFYSQTSECSQKSQQNTTEILRNKHLIAFLWLAIVTFSCGKNFDQADFDHMLGNNQQNNAAICNFCQDPSKHFPWAKMSLISKSLSKIYLVDAVPSDKWPHFTPIWRKPYYNDLIRSKVQSKLCWHMALQEYKSVGNKAKTIAN